MLFAAVALAIAALALAVLSLLEIRNLRREMRSLRDALHPTLGAPAVPQPAPAAPARIHVPRAARRAADWESRIGANWLNRAGVLAVVIGLALLIDYSLTRLGPAGRIAIGYAAAAALLSAGLLLERRPGYTNFARGLLGGGWGALYFTTYALYAIPAARVIASPALGMLLLLAVAAAMIAYSFRYRSEVVTGVAYFAGFLALQVGVRTPLAIAAAIPLAATLLLVAWRFAWPRLALAGLALTYLTFAVQHLPGAWPAGHPALWIVWAMFEAYDIVQRSALPLLPMNAAGFLGASLATTVPAAAPGAWMFLALAAAAYVASAAARALLPPRPALLFRFAGRYEAALTVCAALFAATAFRALSGYSINLAILAAGEILVFTGRWLGSRYILRLGAAVLAIAVAKLLGFDIFTRDNTWTRVAALTSAVIYIDRAAIPSERYFSYAATLVAAFLLLFEAPSGYAGLAWMVAAAVLFAFRKRDFDIQGLLLTTAGFCILLVRHTAVSLAISAALLFALRLAAPGLARAWFTALATVTLAFLLFIQVSGGLLTIAWGAEAVVLLAAGFILQGRDLRLTGLTLLLLCIAKLFVYDVRELDTFARIVSFIGLGALLVGASWAYTRFREQIRRLL